MALEESRRIHRMLLLALLQLPVANHPSLLAIVVVAYCLLIVQQAVRAGKYPWAFGFLGIAVLVNPVLPIARSSSDMMWLNGMALAGFLTAAVFLEAGPRLTVLSITGLLPPRNSL
jgi:hypothetical protein